MSKLNSGSNTKLKHSDPFVKELVKRIPNDLDVSFNENQIAALKIIFNKQSWRDHPVDFRRSVGLIKWRYYFVFIAGRDLRQSKLRDRRLFKLAEGVFLAGVIIFITLSTLLLAYLVKSALRIDLFTGYSLGIWSWFQDSLLN